MRWGRRLLVVMVLLYAAFLAWALAVLPSRVPVHFGVGGDPNGWGSRGELLGVLAGAGLLVLLISVGFAAHLGRGGSLDFVNLPHKEYWTRPEHSDRARTLVAADLYGTAVATLALLGTIGAGAVHVARVGHGGVPWWAVAAFVAYVLGMAGYVVHAYRSRYRPAEAATRHTQG